jgi:hypothetical protein
VDIGSVNIRLLPQPGFDLESFVVHDDPAFSAEPMLRAQEVTAALRLSSLLRGRLEFARLNLTEPSLNLARNREGHWNLETLIERASKMPIAPTGKAKTEVRPGFPYIEANRGRINFKFGQEKKAYAFTDADFALWQDSENTWGIRLKAQPVRTDFNLSDTGTVRVNGSWQRAATLRETPLQFSLQWDRAQLGQLSKLAYGNDKGWRGAVKLSAALAGTPGDLSVETEATVQDFRRYDIPGGDALRLVSRCSVHYSSVDRSLSGLACRAPVGNGAITVDGSIGDVRGSSAIDLVLIAHDVPIQALVALAHHVKKGLPDDLTASGRLDANVRVRGRAGAGFDEVVWQGGGETRDLRLGSKFTNTELAVNRIPFAMSHGSKSNVGAQKQVDRGLEQAPLEPHLDFGPFELALGRPTTTTIRGRVSRSEYSLLMQGDGQVQQLLRVARTVGLPAPQPAADGVAKVDLQLAGAWSGFTTPAVTGKVQLHSIRAAVRGVSAPLEIASVNLLLAPDEVSVRNLTASLAGSTWHGSLILPRQCAGPGACPVRFDLHVDEIATDELSQLLSPSPRARPWYGFLSSSPHTGIPYLAGLRASGQLSANRVTIHKLVVNQVWANVDLENGKLRLSDLRGEVLGGRHTGEWKADYTAKVPEYSGSGTLDRVALGQLSDLMHDGWITGTTTTTYRATASGWTTAELLSSANASLQVEAHDGLLPHITLAGGAGPLHIHHFAGRLLLRDRKFEVQEGKLETAGGIYQVSGTVSLGRALDLKLAHGSTHGFSITGTLTEPRVAIATTPETQAALKP